MPVKKNKNPDIDVLIEGHTDNKPIKTDKFADNWDLSTARASNIVRLLSDENKVNAKRLTAAGRGEYMPKVSNDTPEGRAKNRRTEIILSPKLDELYKMIDKKFERLKKQVIASFKKIYSNGEVFRHSFENFMTNRTHQDREQSLIDARTITYTEFKNLFKLIKNPKYIIKLICTNEDNIKNFKEEYTEIKGL